MNIKESLDRLLKQGRITQEQYDRAVAKLPQ